MPGVLWCFLALFCFMAAKAFGPVWEIRNGNNGDDDGDNDADEDEWRWR